MGGINGWLIDKGTFKYAIQNSSPGDVTGLLNYKKCFEYANFIDSLGSKFSINNAKYNISDAIANKKDLDTNVKNSWSIEVESPYYLKDTYYDGVEYNYAFINSSDYDEDRIIWRTAPGKLAPGKLAPGESENGYKKIILSGNANTDTSADTLIIKCFYKTYSGLAMGFATGNGQERFVVNGKENIYDSYVAFKVNNEADVTVKKYITGTTGGAISGRGGKTTAQKQSKPVKAEIGDNIRFKIVMKNNQNQIVKVDITDTYDANMFSYSDDSKIKYVPNGKKEADVTSEKISPLQDSNLLNFNDIEIPANGHVSIWVYLDVKEDVNLCGQTGNNKVAISNFRINNNNVDNKSGNQVEDSDYVTIRGYSYTIKKEINEIYKSDGTTSTGTKSKKKAEAGDIIEYKVTVTNKSYAILKNLQVTDEIPEGLTYVANSLTSGWSKNSNDVFTYSGSIPAATKDNTGKKTNGIVSFTYRVRVNDSFINKNSTTNITNTAIITQIKNRNNVTLATGQESSVTVKILGYNYSLSKSSDKSVYEPGENIKYTITLTNKTEAKLYNVQINDALPAGLTNITCSEGWTKNGNVYSYSGVVNGKSGDKNGTVTLTITATVSDALIKNADFNIRNTANLQRVQNRNNIDLTSKVARKDVTILGYNAVLTKYITDERENKSIEEKNNSPVVVKKGDTVTYNIKISYPEGVNATGVIYNPSINDALPSGLEYVGNSGEWEKNGNVYTYNGNLNPGDTKILSIQCRVNISNMYLFNVENEATYLVMNNKNSRDVKSVLTLNSNKDYIRMDELDISGIVWDDANANGVLENGEAKISGIKVVLHSFDGKTDSIVSEMTTDSNGKYTFSKVQKGLIREKNGNYENKVGQGYKKYYIEFVYDGIDYRSTEYANQKNINSDGTIKEEYKTDSNAAEISYIRDALIKSLETITYNKATDSGGNTTILEYDKDGKVSKINKGKIPNSTARALSFINPEFKTGYDTMSRLIWLEGTYKGDIEETYKVKENTDYLSYINLGLIKNDFDLSLINKLESIVLTINGQQLKYNFNENTNNLEAEEIFMYPEDILYKYNGEENKAYGTMRDVSTELAIQVNFKTSITNNSKLFTAEVKEFTNYYNKELLLWDTSKEIWVDSNNNGYMDDGEKNTIITSITGTHSPSVVESSKVNYFNKINTKEGLELEQMQIKLNEKLLPGKTADIHLSFIINKDKLIDFVEKKKVELDMISIIGQYSNYDKNGKVAGLIDIDSNPGNLGIEKTEKEVTEDVTSEIYQKEYYEDDTDIKRIKLNFENNRVLSGIVWEDERNTDVEGQKIGDGIMQGAKDKGIEDIIVRLVEIIRKDVEIDGKKDVEFYEIPTKYTAKTNNDGTYKINGYIPGNYVVRFEYGKEEEPIKYNGQDYRSTLYYAEKEPKLENKKGENGNIETEGVLEELIKKVTITKENGEDKELIVSKARDDEKRRLEVMKYSVEMYNKIAETLKPESKETFDYDKTNMHAETVMFTVRNEFLKRNSSIEINKETTGWKENENAISQGKFEAKNIDFGLQERPINNIELKKYIKEIKLETSAGDVLVDAKYDENSNLLDESKGTENLQALNNTEAQQGFRYINVDEDVLQGAKITINYGFIVKNNSEVDHISTNLYGTKETIDILTTNKVKEKIENAINEKEKGISNKYTNSTDYYGHYLGGIYYKGEKTDDVIATIKVDTILDYVDNNLVFSPTDNGGAWGTTLQQDLIGEGYINPNVARYFEIVNEGEDEEKESSTKEYQELKNNSEYEYIVDEVNRKYGFKLKTEVGDKLKFEGFIIDNKEIGYQVDNVKNNLAVTIDDPKLSKLSKQLYPVGKGESSATTELMVSTFLSSENESDDMVYENIAEIIKFTTLTGRRTISAETVGNAKVNYAGYINSDASLAEPDTSIVEKVMLTPPTGLSEDENRTQTITRITIYVATSIALIILTILYAPKIIIKIKDRKFIK